MNMSLHRRGCSLSSLDSFGSDGFDDEDFLNDQLSDFDQLSDRIYNSIFPPPPPPSEGQETPRPLRRRLGAKEAIMAMSSPEIRALDLPLTPAGFPRRQKHLNKQFQNRTQSTPTVIEIYNDVPTSPPPKSLDKKLIEVGKENSDPQIPRQSFVTPVKRTVNKKVLRSRSNQIQPNDSDIAKVQRNKLQKAPSHRRFSSDSAPSPTDLAKGVSTTDLPECLEPLPSLRSMNDKVTFRPKVPFCDRNMNLTMGFR